MIIPTAIHIISTVASNLTEFVAAAISSLKLPMPMPRKRIPLALCVTMMIVFFNY